MTVALVGFAGVLLLCFLGVRIGFATLFVGFAGFVLERGIGPALSVTGSQIIETATNYNLSIIPLFVLMGAFIYRADISSDLYEAAHARLGHLPGGLAQSTVLACAAFSAVCGSSLATAATMTQVALPSMREYKYSDRLATGTIAAGGTLGIMIPPSVPLVIYGIIAEQDIGLLFIAGILPGLLLVSAFMLTVAIWTTVTPSAGPARAGKAGPRKRGAGGSVIAVLLLFTFVLGGIYASVFTPTEAAGIGATGAAAIAMVRGHLRSLSAWIDVLADAAVTTAALFMVVFGTLVFAQFINLSGMPFDLMFLVQDMSLSPLGLVISIAIIALLLGMIFESLGILLLIVPVFLPALIAADVDLIWFGIVVVMVTELGLITPPIGMNVFVVRSVMDDVRLANIFIGVMPFVVALLLVLALILAFPDIATVLPEYANSR